MINKLVGYNTPQSGKAAHANSCQKTAASTSGKTQEASSGSGSASGASDTGKAQQSGCACGLSPNGCTGAHNMLRLNSQIQIQQPPPST